MNDDSDPSRNNIPHEGHQYIANTQHNDHRNRHYNRLFYLNCNSQCRANSQYLHGDRVAIIHRVRDKSLVLLREQRDACKEKLRALGHEALIVIEDVMKNDKTHPKDKLTAALKVVEMLEIDSLTKHRIGKLEIDYTNLSLTDNVDHEKILELSDLETYLENDFEEVDQKENKSCMKDIKERNLKIL